MVGLMALGLLVEPGWNTVRLGTYHYARDLMLTMVV